MHLFHQLRLFANELLAPVGFSIEREQKRPWVWCEPNATVKVGNYTIAIPRTNPLAEVYLRYPDSASHLGQLVSLLEKKYPHLSAIDIGANVGDTACILKSAADIPILCIEGDAVSFGFLKENLKRFKNVSFKEMFLGERSGAIRADFEKGGWNTTIKPGASHSAKSVELTSLDDLLSSQANRSNYKLLKIDTEGFDCPIIRGGFRYINEVQPVIAFEYNRENMEAIGETGLDTLAALFKAGYSRIFFRHGAGGFADHQRLSRLCRRQKRPDLLFRRHCFS